MTRWCAYAVLAIAMVCSSIAMADPMPLRSGLHEASSRPSSTARERSGKPAQVARREANGTSVAIVPDLIDRAPVVRVWIGEARTAGVRRWAAEVVVACSRAPPRTRLSFH